MKEPTRITTGWQGGGDVAVPTILSLASGGGGLDLGVARALGGPGHEQGSTQGANLKRSAEQWATPSARDADKWHYREPGHARQVNLSGQASYEAGRQAPRMMRAGEVFPSDSGPRRLNPQFVEWLMGWPAGWTTLVAPTSSEFSATE